MQYMLQPEELRNKLNVQLLLINNFKNSLNYSGATLWNSLPSKARYAESLGSFKRAISKAL